MSSVGGVLPSSRSAGETTASAGPHAPPRGLRGLLAISYLSLGRATVTGVLLSLIFGGLPIVFLFRGAHVLFLLSAGLALPAGLLLLPVVGVLQGQRLPLDYRQLGAGSQLRLWLRGPHVPAWPLPAGALTDPAIRAHAPLIHARAAVIAALAPGARSVLTAELSSALAGAGTAAAPMLVDEAIARVRRWEEAGAGMPAVGAKLYLRHEPLSRRAARARSAAARLGVPSDSLNYFWRGQVLLLPPTRSHRTLARLIDALLASGVADPGTPLPLQITVQGELGDEAKLIAFAQLAANGLDLTISGPERRGDEGNLIARGQRAPVRVSDGGEAHRSDFLFSLVLATVPDLVAAGYADQHHRDLRVVQTLSAALLAARAGDRRRNARRDRLAAVWREFARDFLRLCEECGAGPPVQARYLDAPLAQVWPLIDAFLARKAAHAGLTFVSRSVRDKALALVEFTLITHRLAAEGRLRRIRMRWADAPLDYEAPLRSGARRVRRAIRAGARVALARREGATLHMLLEGPALPARRRGG